MTDPLPTLKQLVAAEDQALAACRAVAAHDLAGQSTTRRALGSASDRLEQALRDHGPGLIARLDRLQVAALALIEDPATDFLVRRRLLEAVEGRLYSRAPDHQSDCLPNPQASAAAKPSDA